MGKIVREYNNNEIDCYGKVTFEKSEGVVETAFFTNTDTEEMLETLRKLMVSVENGSKDQIKRFSNQLKKDLELGVDVTEIMRKTGVNSEIENEEKVNEIGN